MAISRVIAFAFLLASISCTTASTVTSSTKSDPPLSLEEISSGTKATVLFWWATECPCVSRYQSRIEDLKGRYGEQGISFIAISSNSDDDEARNTKVSKDRAFNLPILKDNGGQLARALGVMTTPTVVLVDQQGNVKYQGWIDNERFLGDKGRIAYLENAIKEFLSASKISTASSPTYGCRVTRRFL